MHLSPLAKMALLLLPLSAAGQTGMQGNVCVQALQPGASCLASDVRVASIDLLSIDGGACLGNGLGSVDVEVNVVLTTNGGPDRFDIGTFIATDGGSALSGNACYHDYLAPPLTPTPIYTTSADGLPSIENGPWWRAGDGGDLCGDIQKQFNGMNTQAILAQAGVGLPLTLPCTDTNDDGVLDVSMCVAWSSTVASTCSGLSDAIPASNTKCGCGRYDIAGILIPASANLSITKTDHVDAVASGGPVSYSITVANAGPTDALSSKVVDALSADLAACSWTCSGFGNGTCTASGNDGIDDTMSLPSGAQIVYMLDCFVVATSTGTLTNTASVTPPTGVVDPDESDNTSTDSDFIDDAVFADGFESK